ncbi:hypothetical protein STSP2_00267 [Anaerohalosphaera lusitana]|uniref:DUF1571 domain-containing protein n=1 Tax=Anaerohalosphaera lusitana TaxID=1936003 RepID=A0A1U9NHY8_9BACT|nr:DUF1571 domain-containing protein [Anaerohalosphaera lusitana]AQT67126.1 hypothetical protein STSP2_00267 [Anaerohalosphaera lusitana]
METFRRSLCFGLSGGVEVGIAFLLLLGAAVFAGSEQDVRARRHLKFWNEREGVSAEDARGGVDPNIIELAKMDQISLYKKAIKHYDETIRDYTGKLMKHERVNGELRKKQVVRFKFKEDPFSVYMEWVKNAGSADKVLYVEGENDGNMVVHPTTLFGLIKSVERAPDCKEAMEENRYPVTMFGFRRMMANSLAMYEMADEKGELETVFLGITDVDGRKCLAIEGRLPDKKRYDRARVVVQLDVERLVPLNVISFNWDGELLGRYKFSDLKFNTGLSEAEFEAENNGL